MKTQKSESVNDTDTKTEQTTKKKLKRGYVSTEGAPHREGYKRPLGRKMKDEKLVDNYIVANVATLGTEAAETEKMRLAGYQESTIQRGQQIQGTQLYKERVEELRDMLGGSVFSYAISVQERIERGEHKTESLAQNVKTLQTLVNISKALLPTIKRKEVTTDPDGNRVVVWQTLNG